MAQITEEYGTSLVAIEAPRGIGQTNPVALEFSIVSVERLSSNQVRVRFSLQPELSDATTPANYSIPGFTITSIDFNSNDPLIYDLNLQQPLTPNTYTLTVSSTISPYASTLTLQAPYALNFIVSQGNATLLTGGAVNKSNTDLVSQFLNPAYKYKKNWKTLSETLSVGDTLVSQVADSCLAQAYLATASGSYLEKRALEFGISKPSKTWIADSLFQDLAISVINKKLTEDSFLNVLEVLYGAQAVRAFIQTSLFEPYSLFDGGWVRFLVDEKELIDVVFNQEDFNVISQATAQEVSSVITQAMESYGYAQVAQDITTGENYVQVYSGSKGLGSSIRVISGTLQPLLDFPTNLFPNATIGSIWSVEAISLEVARYHCNTTAQYNLGLVDSGDYINILDPAFTVGNRGSFIITNTGTDNGAWGEAATLITPRGDHTATLLQDSQVLVCGGYNGTYLTECELYDSITRTFTATGPLGTARSDHSATLLPNGKVLIAGGHNASGNLTTCELYDPTTETFSSTGPMANARGAHTATLLNNGKVLICGGFDTDYLDEAELYDPTAGTFSNEGTLTAPRFNCTATLLMSGHVLICGGENSTGYLASAEIYDPTAHTFTATGDMTIDRSTHTATLLSSSKVLICGGMDGGYLASCELYDPVAHTFSLTTSMLDVRAEHTATLLSTGNVLVTGGFGAENPASAEEYLSGFWSFASSMTTSRWNHTATLMPDGEVLVIGGFGTSLAPTTAETFNYYGFYVEVDNPSAVNEVVFPTVDLGVTIYSPTKFTPYSTPNCAQVTQAEGRSIIDLPVTAQIVSRNYSNAAYLRENARLDITTITRDITGLTTVTTDEAHGLVAGDWFEILETRPDYQVQPALTNGSPSTAFVANLATGTSDLTSRSWASYDSTRPSNFARAIKDLTGNVWVVGGELEASEINSLALFSILDITENSSGSRQNSYQWGSYDDGDIEATGSALAILDDPNYYNQLLIVGGANSGTPSNTTQIVFPLGDSFSLLTRTVCPELVTDATLEWFSSPTSRAYLIGGRNAGGVLSNVYIYNPNGDSWAAGSHPLNVARFQHQSIPLSSTTVLVMGGRTTTGHPYDPIGTNSNIDAFAMGTVLNSCEIVSTTLASTFTGSMAYARYAFGKTVLPDGRILVCGGIGYNPSHPLFLPAYSSARQNELKSVEAYDPVARTWSSLGDMSEPHSYCFCEYIASENKVFVFGGYSSLLIEYLDLKDMRWKRLPNSLSQARVFGAGALAGLDVPLLSGGSQILPDPDPVTSSSDSLTGSTTLGIASYNNSDKGLNGFNQVVTQVSHTQFTYQSLPYFASSASGQNIASAGINDPRINGPFSYDSTGVAVTGTSTLTTSTLNMGSNSLVQLASTTGFTNSGWIVFNFGTASQLGPVQFYSVNGGSLTLDPGFRFTKDVPVGSEVRLLSGKSVFVPLTSENGFHLTASFAGRLAAINLLTKISAAGIPLDFNVKYPGDRGLGNAGRPVSGISKISDIIEIFGGDDLDHKIVKARSGNG